MSKIIVRLDAGGKLLLVLEIVVHNLRNKTVGSACVMRTERDRVTEKILQLIANPYDPRGSRFSGREDNALISINHLGLQFEMDTGLNARITYKISPTGALRSLFIEDMPARCEFEAIKEETT